MDRAGHSETVASVAAVVAGLELGGALAARIERLQVGVVATVAPVGSGLVDAGGALVAVVERRLGALVQVLDLLHVGQKQGVRVGQGLRWAASGRAGARRRRRLLVRHLVAGLRRRRRRRSWRLARRARRLTGSRRLGLGRQGGRLAHVQLLRQLLLEDRLVQLDLVGALRRLQVDGNVDDHAGVQWIQLAGVQRDRLPAAARSGARRLARLAAGDAQRSGKVEHFRRHKAVPGELRGDIGALDMVANGSRELLIIGARRLLQLAPEGHLLVAHLEEAQ